MERTTTLLATWSRRAGVAAALIAALATAACTTGARRGALTAPLSEATLIGAAHPLFQSVIVGPVVGGRGTDLVGPSNISSFNFRRALQTSLDLRAMLSDEDPVAPVDARFLLSAEIDSVEREFLDIDLDVTTTVTYTLSDLDGAPLFVRQVVATYEAQFEESFIRSERFRLANEGSGQANIAAFLEALVADVDARPAVYAPPPPPAPSELDAVDDADAAALGASIVDALAAQDEAAAVEQ